MRKVGLGRSCLLQLALNLLAARNGIAGSAVLPNFARGVGAAEAARAAVVHIGCAGFNKVLGPWRWQLRGLTGLYLAGLWFVAARRGAPAGPCCGQARRRQPNVRGLGAQAGRRAGCCCQRRSRSPWPCCQSC